MTHQDWFSQQVWAAPRGAGPTSSETPPCAHQAGCGFEKYPRLIFKNAEPREDTAHVPFLVTLLTRSPFFVSLRWSCADGRRLAEHDGRRPGRELHHRRCGATGAHRAATGGSAL